MWAFKTILFIALFSVCVGGSFVLPELGVLGYVAHYSIGPERQWWAAPARQLGIRYSFTLALMTAVGMAINWRRLRFGKKFLCGQEKFMLLFLAMVWVAYLFGPATVGKYTTIDHPSVKFSKVVLFVLMMTHVMTTSKTLKWLMTVLTIGVLVLGIQAWTTPQRAFISGRLDTIGGPDFAESNYFAAYMAASLWLAAALFLTSGWKGKILAGLAGVFGANAIVLARSRGAVVGLFAGALAAAVMAPKNIRLKAIAGLVIAASGAIYLADEQFIERIGTIGRSEETRDSSAQSRIELWRAGWKMLKANPITGVGPGNFYQSIGRYNRSLEFKDAHNTYVRAACETGLLGFTAFVLVIFSSFRTLWQIRKLAHRLPDELARTASVVSYGMMVSICTLLASCLTMSLPYVEFWWWIIMLPVCLKRVLENEAPDEMIGPDALPVGADGN